ncbi:MAG: hypothetical protein M3R70_06790 [Actinomycetota bacterium]|nr:hypothetical protein [Actinomycetota bacterium]
MPHLRLPAISHRVTSFLWGLGFGLFIWLGGAAVGVSSATAFIFGAVFGAAIFLFVLVFGDDSPA